MCVFVERQDDDDDDEVFSQTRRQARRGHLSSEGRLSSLRAVQTFQSFLVGTAGEKFWHLWLDIERARTIRDHIELSRCYAADSFHRSIPFSSLCFSRSTVDVMLIYNSFIHHDNGNKNSENIKKH